MGLGTTVSTELPALLDWLVPGAVPPAPQAASTTAQMASRLNSMPATPAFLFQGEENVLVATEKPPYKSYYGSFIDPG